MNRCFKVSQIRIASGESSRNPLFQNRGHSFSTHLLSPKCDHRLSNLLLTKHQAKHSSAWCLITPKPNLVYFFIFHFFFFTKTKQKLPSYLGPIGSKPPPRGSKRLPNRNAFFKKNVSYVLPQAPAPAAKGTGAGSLASQLIYNSILFCVQSQTLSSSSDPSFSSQGGPPLPDLA